MVDYRADFTLEEQTPIEATLVLGEQTTIEADLRMDVFNNDHNALVNRDLPNQHPIEAITGLQDILNKLWTYTFEQAEASDTWIIKHNLGRNPSVVVVDSAGTVFYPAVHYDNENQCTISMNGATTGKAYLN
jgi:hypothetical protein